MSPMGRKGPREARSFLLLLLLSLQLTGGLATWIFCSNNGFTQEDYYFTVPRKLEEDVVIGRVTLEQCGHSAVHFKSLDPHFDVLETGDVVVTKPIKLHTPTKKFKVVATYNEGKEKKFTFVNLVRRSHPHKKESSNSDVKLKRQKRDWVIPLINVLENERGPFPKPVVQIKSNRAKEIKIFYSITGQGADSPPVGLFIVERETGWIYVTAPLDREHIPFYNMLVHAVADTGKPVEDPMDILVKVQDQNDCKPYFIESVFRGSVPEGSRAGTPVMFVKAEDDDEAVDSYNGVVVYAIIKQEPQDPSDMMFTINKDSGLISVIATGLDCEKIPMYTLTIMATDSEGKGFSTTGTAVITVTDVNDNAPIFNPTTYTVDVRENEAPVEVARLTVTDADAANTDASAAVFKITKGNEGGYFKVETDANNNGLVTTVKGLDFEGPKNVFQLNIIALNKANFSVPLPTSTATVTVNVVDVNEAPIFMKQNYSVSVSEDLPEGQEVASYTATDPDRYQNQKIMYSIGFDPAGWLFVNKDNGIITGNGKLDRESVYVNKNVYKAIILAVDTGSPVATGTGTLLLTLLDVNDNAPYLEDTRLSFCYQDSNYLTIPIIDRDESPNTGPFTVELPRETRENWTATVVDNNLQMKPLKNLDLDDYDVPIILKDSQGKANTTRLKITICKCTGDGGSCEERAALAGGLGVPAIIGILAGILCLLILVLLLLLFLKRKKVVKEPLLPPEDETRDNVYYYDEEGGGEEDQDFDLSQLHRGLDARPDVIRNDVAPTFVPAPQYRPRPSNPDEIGNFIDENLNAADNDPTAPPYDSLLVFDYEGSGSDAASLSSLNSSNSDEDQDYSGMSKWGPRFNKLADMYGGDED